MSHAVSLRTPRVSSWGPGLSGNSRATPQPARAVGTFFRVPKSYGVAFETRTGNRGAYLLGWLHSVMGMITPTIVAWSCAPRAALAVMRNRTRRNCLSGCRPNPAPFRHGTEIFYTRPKSLSELETGRGHVPPLLRLHRRMAMLLRLCLTVEIHTSTKAGGLPHP